MNRKSKISATAINWDEVLEEYRPGLPRGVDAVFARRHMEKGYADTRELIAQGKEIPPFADVKTLENMPKVRRERIEAYECGALHCMRMFSII